MHSDLAQPQRRDLAGQHPGQGIARHFERLAAAKTLQQAGGGLPLSLLQHGRRQADPQKLLQVGLTVEHRLP